MDEGDTNKQLHEQNELLKASVSEIEPLKAKIRELEARLFSPTQF